MAARITESVATQSALDVINVVVESPANMPASKPAIESEEQSQLPEPTQMDESNANTRSKSRTLAIVAALYMVLFIAALDQTIIA